MLLQESYVSVFTKSPLYCNASERKTVPVRCNGYDNTVSAIKKATLGFLTTILLKPAAVQEMNV